MPFITRRWLKRLPHNGTPQAQRRRKGGSATNSTICAAALQWTRDGGDLTLGLQLGGALTRFWRNLGYISEGRVWLAELLAQDDAISDAAAHAARLSALHGAAWLAADQHDFAQAEQLIEQRMLLLRALGQSEDETNLLTNTALQARVVGDYRQATQLLEEALVRYRAQDNRGSLATGGLGFTLYFLALVLREQGNFSRAEMLFKECIDFHAEIEERTGVAQGLLGLSDVARDQGDIVQTRTYADQSLAIFQEFGTQWAIGFVHNNLAQAAYLDGDLSLAFALADESLTLFQSLQADASLAEVLVAMGHILQAQGDLISAHETLTEALRLAWALGPRLLVAAALEGLAGVIAQSHQESQAVRFLAAASALRTQMGTPIRPADQPTVVRTLAATRTALGADSFEAEWAAASNFLSNRPSSLFSAR